MARPLCAHASDALGPSVPGKGAPRECALKLFARPVHTLAECAGCEKHQVRARAAGAPAAARPNPCRHRSERPVGSRSCQSCRGRVELFVFGCALHGTCTPETPLDGAACCATCDDRPRG